MRVIVLFRLVIILIVHQYRVLPFKGKGQTPAFVDPDRPMTSKLAFEWMQFSAREVDAIRSDGGIQSRRVNASACAIASSVNYFTDRRVFRV
ncbi:MAG: hypothetical protein ACREXY_01780 [Gammaproteobacteria bacterium]